jgi:hypothetical protein
MMGRQKVDQSQLFYLFNLEVAALTPAGATPFSAPARFCAASGR